jgi:copper(I)-binding protein
MNTTTTTPNGRAAGPRRAMTAAMTAVLAATLLAGCGSDDEFEITGAWARTSPMSATAGAVYLDITADVDDRLITASVPADVADSVEIHETVMRGEMDDGAMNDGEMATDNGDATMNDGEMAEDGMEDSEGAMDGAMTMRELEDGLALPAGETVNLEPGGYHVMLLDLPDPLETGETFDLTLEFESGESRVISIEVRDEAP